MHLLSRQRPSKNIDDMKKIRTIIVDDEPAARSRVAKLLAEDPDMEVVRECSSGAQAIECIQKCKPDLRTRAGAIRGVRHRA